MSTGIKKRLKGVFSRSKKNDGPTGLSREDSRMNIAASPGWNNQRRCMPEPPSARLPTGLSRQDSRMGISSSPSWNSQRCAPAALSRQKAMLDMSPLLKQKSAMNMSGELSLSKQNSMMNISRCGTPTQVSRQNSSGSSFDDKSDRRQNVNGSKRRLSRQHSMIRSSQTNLRLSRQNSKTGNISPLTTRKESDVSSRSPATRKKSRMSGSTRGLFSTTSMNNLFNGGSPFNKKLVATSSFTDETSKKRLTAASSFSNVAQLFNSMMGKKVVPTQYEHLNPIIKKFQLKAGKVKRLVDFIDRIKIEMMLNQSVGCVVDGENIVETELEKSRSIFMLKKKKVLTENEKMEITNALAKKSCYEEEEKKSIVAKIESNGNFSMEEKKDMIANLKIIPGYSEQEKVEILGELVKNPIILEKDEVGIAIRYIRSIPGVVSKEVVILLYKEENPDFFEGDKSWMENVDDPIEAVLLQCLIATEELGTSIENYQKIVIINGEKCPSTALIPLEYDRYKEALDDYFVDFQ